MKDQTTSPLSFPERIRNSPYLLSWNWVRFLRLFIGGALLVQGIQMSDWMVASMGGLFGLMALLNTGCGGGSCQVK